MGKGKRCVENVTKFSCVLVAGGAGFIGSHIVDRLMEEGMEVTVLDNFYSGVLENIKRWKKNRRLHLVRGDVCGFELVRKAVAGVDAVFNDAAVVSVPRSMEDPILANEVNVGGTLNLLKASVEEGVKRFIQASSASVYGNTRALPIKEGSLVDPISPYAVAELAADNYARVFHRAYGLETFCLRYFNVYGPRQTYSAYSGVATILSNKLIRGQRPVIYGDGNQTRDFVYVDDVVEANMLTLRARRGAGEAFNIATGRAHTTNELLQNLQTRMGKQNLKPIYKPARSGDIKHSCASIDKAQKTLKYKPRFTLKKGIAKLVKSQTTPCQ